LLIVESPSKCKKIESFLGDNYQCIASVGHIRQIDGLKSIDIDHGFAIRFSIIPEKKSHVESMRKTIANYRPTHILLATDDDREGEAIAWHICDVFGLDPTAVGRIVFHEITRKAVVDAVAHPRHIDLDLVHAQQSRQVLDMLVGFKISPVLWKYLYTAKDHALSAGRCQTPALRLVYDNDVKSKTEDAESVYKTTGIFTSQQIEFILNRTHATVDEMTTFYAALDSHTDYSVRVRSDGRVSTRAPPKPFNTSNLLQTASSQLHMGPKETMANCQKLYQEGFITYMRTDSMVYAAPFLEEGRQFVAAKYGENLVPDDFDAILLKDAKNPHEAIRVTHLEAEAYTGTDTGARAKTLYALIWRNTVQSMMTAAKYMVYDAEIGGPLETAFEHSVEVPQTLGWKTVEAKDTIEQAQSLANGRLLCLRSLKNAPPVSVESTVHVKHRFSHYGEASLIKRLEDLGIGRPSTFAMLVDTIQERGYVEKRDLPGLSVNIKEFCWTKVDRTKTTERAKVFGAERGKLVITPLGILVSEFLHSHFTELFSYDYTERMETSLDVVAHGQTPWTEPCATCLATIDACMRPLNGPGGLQREVFAIDDTHDLVYQKYGPTIRRKLGEGGAATTYEYKSVRHGLDLDLDKLRAGEYALSDLLEEGAKQVGEYEGQPIYLKHGKFGAYFECGEKKVSLKSLSVGPEDDGLEEAAQKAFEPKENSPGIRHLTDEISVRHGKYGPYVYYKTARMKKPKFIPMKGCPKGGGDEELLAWIREKIGK
jgi:DNA topoisomerase-1